MSQIKKNLASRRQRSQTKNKFSELKFCRDICEETKELFFEYDKELNIVLEDLSTIHKPATKTTQTDEENEIIKVEDAEDKTSNISGESEEKAPESNEFNDKKEDKSASAPPWMKKLFKKIALETHPDKISNRGDLTPVEKTEREAFYKQAVFAIEESKEMDILEIAILLLIDPGISSKQQLKIISKEIENVMEEIESYRSKVAWTWGESFGEKEIRLKLLKYIMGILKMPAITDDIIEQYLAEFEADGDMKAFIKKMGGKKRRENILDRKIGEHPAPSLSQLRKNKNGT